MFLDKIKVTKYTIVGVFCTFFSMISYPTLLFFIKSENKAFFIATSLNISMSYVAQSLITFNLTPTLLKFLEYIYVSLIIIMLGNLIYFSLYYITNNGLLSYYLSWLSTSIFSYFTHYKITFNKK